VFLLKVSLLFCGVALLLAIVVTLTLIIVGHLTGDYAVGATHRGWLILLGIWWAASFLVATQASKFLHVFPLSMRK
jgi:hypothetical protein